VGLTQRMIDRGIGLQTAVTTSTYYFGFNMMDEVLGGRSEKLKNCARLFLLRLILKNIFQFFKMAEELPHRGLFLLAFLGTLLESRG
jgi:hypothetical protein